MNSVRHFQNRLLIPFLVPLLAFLSYLIMSCSLQKSAENKNSDIKLGNEIIANIELYQKQYGLPEADDFQRLSLLGFKQRGNFIVPNYKKLNKSAFELVFSENLGGPYLLWNSYQKKWQKSIVKRIISFHTEEDVVSLIEETILYRKTSKLIDSLSSGENGLALVVNIQDSAQNIFKVTGEDLNENKTVTYFNFLVDANTMIILNPNGKL